MGIREAIAALMQELISLILGTGAGWFVGPFLTLFFIMRFLRWVVTQGRGGPDAEEISEQAGEYQRRITSTPGRLDAARGKFRRRY